MGETLFHYSAKGAFKYEPRDYAQHGRIFSYEKPQGLWVSVAGEFGWKEWCEGEQFRLESLAETHRVILTPDANILRLSNCDDLDQFTDRYSRKQNLIPKTLEFNDTGIDWRLVAEDYQGIIISPYQWERRMADKTRWYYGWDCASGCIWSSAAIDRVVKMSKRFERELHPGAVDNE